MSRTRYCAVVPTFDNPATIFDVVQATARVLDVVVVDDGSGCAGRAAVAELGAQGLAHVVHRPVNGGKGAAVRTGFETAKALGYTHALQVDADGQHHLEDIERFLASSRNHPESLILGAPVFDESAPWGRKIARTITIAFTHLETGGRVIRDPMCGFRVYPLELACKVAQRCGLRMDFDIEVAVRMVWAGVSVVNLDTRVHYPENGVSHFQLVRDNLRISWMHSRLCTVGCLRLMGRPLGWVEG